MRNEITSDRSLPPCSDDGACPMNSWCHVGATRDTTVCCPGGETFSSLPHCLCSLSLLLYLHGGMHEYFHRFHHIPYTSMLVRVNRDRLGEIYTCTEHGKSMFSLHNNCSCYTSRYFQSDHSKTATYTHTQLKLLFGSDVVCTLSALHRVKCISKSTLKSMRCWCFCATGWIK